MATFTNVNTQVQGTREERIAANAAKRMSLNAPSTGVRTPLGYTQSQANSQAGPLPMPTTPLADPYVTEGAGSLEEYQSQMESVVPFSREQSDAMVEQGGFQNYGSPNAKFAGTNIEGEPEFAGVNSKDFGEAASHYELPSNVGILDVDQLNTSPDYNKSNARVDDDNANRADGMLVDMSDFMAGRLDSSNEAYDAELESAVTKMGLGSIDQLSSISALSLAGSMRTQDSFIAGHSTGANALTIDDIESYGVEHQGVQVPSQIGMNQDDLTRSIADRLKKLLKLSGVETANLNERDYQVIGSTLLQQSMDTGQLVRTKVGNKITYVPTGAHVGSILGLQSDALVGADLQLEVSDVPTSRGNAATMHGALPGQSGTRSPSGKQPVQPALDNSKDVMGHMAMGMDVDVVSAIYLQISDVLANLVNPNASTDVEDQGILIYSTSPFADMFKLDFGTADAAYRNKVYESNADNVNGPEISPAQRAKLQQDVNKITNTRVDEVITNLNKQLKLIKEGKYDEANKAFYYTFGNGDINGRIYNTTHNGNYTLDKVISRQTQKAKINPRLIITKEGFDKRNTRIDRAAKSLFAEEGNPKAFNRILNGMPSDIEAEISFRVVMVSTILKDAKHARKAVGRNEGTTADEAAIALAESSGLSGLNNISNKAMYDAYSAMNRNDPLRIMRHLGNQGAAIRSSLDNMNKDIMSLEVIAFDPRSNAKERKMEALEKWGDITTADIKPLAAHANERGELRQQMSIRNNAFRYLEALENPEASNHIELDFEVELDAKQSGPFLQALIAPGKDAGDTLDHLGFESNTSKGDLRDVGKAILLGGVPTATAYVSEPAMAGAWDKLIKKAFQGEKSGVARELFLKQTIMQYYYGKPKNMFGDIAEEILGYFDEEVNQDSLLKDMSGKERVEGLAGIISNMLGSPQFDVNYISVMKNLGQSLALTGSDLVIDGPMGPINLTMESLAQAFTDADESGDVKTPQQLRLDIIELIDQDNNKFNVNVTRRTTDTHAAKVGRSYDQSKPLSGRNYPSKPGKRLADSLGVLIIHQLDNAVMNHTVNTVNMHRDRNNPLPAKVIYDAVITNAAGFLRYSHTYNNESIPMLQNWNLGSAITKTVDKAAADFKKSIEGKDSFNLSVIEGGDGNLHGVERYAVLTSWLDDYYIDMPKQSDYPDNVNLFKAKEAEYTSRSMINATTHAKSAGYLPPLFNPAFLEHGVLERGEPMILNAVERSNMHISKQHFDFLFNVFQQRYKGRLSRFKNDIETNKAKILAKPHRKVNHLGM